MKSIVAKFNSIVICLAFSALSNGAAMSWDVVAVGWRDMDFKSEFHPSGSPADPHPDGRVAAGGLESLLQGGKEARLPVPPVSDDHGSRRGWRILLLGSASLLGLWATAVVVAVYLIGRWQRSRHEDELRPQPSIGDADPAIVPGMLGYSRRFPALGSRHLYRF